MAGKLSGIFKLAILSTLSLGVVGCGSDGTVANVSSIEVPVLKVQKSDLAIPIEFVGQTKGAVDAEVRARVEGIVQGVHFQEGKEIKEGDLLYTIDPAPFEAKVAEANAKVAEAETRLIKTESDLKRIRPLAAMRAVSARDLDAAEAQKGVAQGALEAANAVLESAKIELGYTKISASISGMIGLSKAQVGEFVGRPPNNVVLTTISQLEPIHVRFSVSEKDYLYFSRLRQKQTEEMREPLELTLQLSDGSIHPEKGRIASIDSQIDPSTGSLAIESSFPNPGKILRPGQFAKVKTIGETLKGVISVPKAAIREIQGVRQIAVVTASNVIEVRIVTTGREIGTQVEVLDGLADGELIVAESQHRLKNGTVVTPKIIQE